MNKESGRRVLRFFMLILTGDVIESLDPRRYIKTLVLLVLMALLFIGNNYNGQKQVAEIERLREDLKELKYKESNNKRRLTRINKQSSLEELLRDRGISVSKEPPHKIVLKED